MSESDFPYPGERMTASQNDLLATEAEKAHDEANVAFYARENDRLRKQIESLKKHIHALEKQLEPSVCEEIRNILSEDERG
jgi:hypothetical protein